MSETQWEMMRKIEQGKDLTSIVSTMKLLSAVSIGHIESSLRSLEDYYNAVTLSLSACFHARDCNNESKNSKEFSHNPREKANRKNQRNEKSNTIIVLGSAQGLVGQFNNSVASFLANSLSELEGSTTIWASGERVASALSQAEIHCNDIFVSPDRVETVYDFLDDIFKKTDIFNNNPTHHTVHIFLNKRAFSGDSFKSCSIKLLPFHENNNEKKVENRKKIDTIQNLAAAQAPWPSRVTPDIWNGVSETLLSVAREFVFISLFRACCESLIAENLSRFAAMQRAEKNIHEMLENMTLAYHRERQSCIDEELFDVIMGGLENNEHATNATNLRPK